MASKRYRVAGKHPVFDTEPGKTFTRDIEPVQEARLLASGAIEKVGGRPAKPTLDHEAEARTQAEIASEIDTTPPTDTSASPTQTKE